MRTSSAYRTRRELFDSSTSVTPSMYIRNSKGPSMEPCGTPENILTEIVPITLFYLTFLLFQVNVTSSPMTCYIFYSQVMMLATTPSGKGYLLEHDAKMYATDHNICQITCH